MLGLLVLLSLFIAIGGNGEINKECLSWAAQGECLRSVVYMRDHCGDVCADIHKIDFTTNVEANLNCGKGDTVYPDFVRAFGGVPTAYTIFNVDTAALYQTSPNYTILQEEFINAWRSHQPILCRGCASEFGKDTGNVPLREWPNPPFTAMKKAFGNGKIRSVRNDKYGDDVFHFNSKDYQMALHLDTFPKFIKVLMDETKSDTVYLAEQPIPDQMWTQTAFSPSLINQLKAFNLTHMLRANLWMGKGVKINPAHHDPYHNMLVMFSGKKTFHMLHPLDRRFIYPYYPPGGAESSYINNIMAYDEESMAAYPCFAHAKPVSVTIQAGDVFFYAPRMVASGAF